ncbi:branched-chain amino acid ABC transporter permease [Marivibrio halodurans]|uniref:Branched-chain amino acid ABC transporter permease n=1 Tax=Marivibrio halodurans TaxID=2039722 RepID=A0A8J7SAI4_9PROT|nr:branched-chain amino acid ABC transporter permease [Marivibrio halodurans]MBP5858487.1 branched-chain amino acid ABC transporter permease [Marivibrio halodurans]
MASITQFNPSSPKRDLIIMVVFAVAVLTAPIWLAPVGASYPDLLQRFAIFGIFALGFNILFGLTGYLSFGHAAFLGVGSYAAVWIFKLLTMNVVLAIIFGVLVAAIFAVVVGFICLRRSGIYFAILTLAFAQMFYNLAYSVLTPITNGETALTLALDDPRAIDAMFGVDHGAGLPAPSLFGLELTGFTAFYFCAVVLIIAFWVSLKIFRSPFGLKLLAIKSNQNRMLYTGFNPKPYLLVAFVISGMYAGLAGSLMVITDPLAGAERMQWTASGEVVLMTILGGAGTLIGPLLGAGIIKYFENIFSALHHAQLAESFGFLPNALVEPVVSVVSLFVGEGWHLTLGILFMLVVIFLPGGLMEGIRRLSAYVRAKRAGDGEETVAGGATQPSE